MVSLRSAMGVTAALMASATIAAAAERYGDWTFESDAGAFDDSLSNAMMYTSSGEMGFGFRCNDDGLFGVFHIGPSGGKDWVATLNKGSPKLLMRADRSEVLEYRAEVHTINDRTAVLAKVDGRALDAAANATRAFSVTWRFFDNEMEEASFSAKGTTRAIAALRKTCGVD